MSKFSERLSILRTGEGLTQQELADRLGCAKSTVNMYEKGNREPNMQTLMRLAELFRVGLGYLMGQENTPLNGESLGIRPVSTKRFPMLGTIACGKPIYAEEEHESYVDAAADIDADFCLTAKGDSMVGARIHDGDIVFIRKESTVDNGEIAAVVIEGEATLKRWYYYPQQQKLILTPENPAYEPFVFVGKELDSVLCLGQAVCFMSRL